MLGENSGHAETLPSIPPTLKKRRSLISNNTLGKHKVAALFQDDDHRFRTITPRSIKRESKSIKKPGGKRARKAKASQMDTTLLDTDNKHHGSDLPINNASSPSSSLNTALKQEDDDEVWEIHFEPLDQVLWGIPEVSPSTLQQNKDPESTPVPTTLNSETAASDVHENDDESDCSSIIDLCNVDQGGRMDTHQEMDTYHEKDTHQENDAVMEDVFYDALDLQSPTHSDTSDDYLSPLEDESPF